MTPVCFVAAIYRSTVHNIHTSRWVVFGGHVLMTAGGERLIDLM